LFQGARFLGDAEFSKAEFSGEALFHGAKFSGYAKFSETAFSGDAWFSEADFRQEAEFSGANFRGNVEFRRAEFSKIARFRKATFLGDAEFSECKFRDNAGFGSAKFSEDAQFSKAEFSKDVMFHTTTFDKAQRLGPWTVGGQLGLDQANFADRLELEATAESILCRRTRFNAGVVLRIAGDVALEGTEFPRPARAEPRRAGQRFRLISLRRTDTTNLVLASVDLSACRFAGAHNLDKLRIEGAIPFAFTPRGFKTARVGGYGPALWMWTRRQTLAEEHHLRHDRPRRWPGQRTPYPKEAAKGQDWYPVSCQPPYWFRKERPNEEELKDPPSDEELIDLYRSLRKAREDSKDEPGAADFYYGEMELRRLADHTPWAERFVLNLYWLVSGYGLRGLRALIALAVLILGTATLFRYVGFRQAPPHPAFWGSLLYAAKSVLSLPATEQLTSWGELLRIMLRLTGPLLLGLALLSVRNRIKR
jgi:uncharacterized protein YjbI with pentapeptide repeats